MLVMSLAQAPVQLTTCFVLIVPNLVSTPITFFVLNVWPSVRTFVTEHFSKTWKN